MNLEELVKETQQGESQKLEFKRGLSKEKIGIALSAFSNSEGGKIFLGVEDKKTVVGISADENLIIKINSIASSCLPPSQITISKVPFEKGRHIVIINIHECEKKPCKFKGVAYKRVDCENNPLTTEEELQMALLSHNMQFDRLQARNEERQALLQDVDENKILEYIDLAQKSRNKKMNFVDTEQFLINNKLLLKNYSKITNAAILLFGKNPQNFIKNSRVAFSFFNADTVTEKFTKQLISGSVVEQINYCIILIQRFAPPWSEIKGTTRIDKSPYPYEALRELVTNAITHKNYFIPGEVNVKVFSNRIEISNPGGLMPGIERGLLIKGQNSLSIKRNMLLADMLDKAKLMEQSGHGIPRVLRLINEHGFEPPKFEINENSFKVTIFSNPENIKATKQEIKDMSTSERKVLKIILDSRDFLSNQELIKKTKFTPVWVNRLTRRLLEKEQIKRVKRGKEVYFSK